MMHNNIYQCSLFYGMKDAEIQSALSFFEAKKQTFAKNEIIKKADQPLKAFGLVLSGSITVYMDDFDGNRIVMSSAQASETFGESLCFLQRNEPVYIIATQNTELLWLHLNNLQNICDNEHTCDLRNRFISLLASRALNMNDRIQVLSKFTIREKLITYFSQCSHKAASNSFDIPLDRASLASYIGTERSALSRELSKMQKENILFLVKNKVTLMQK